MSCLKPSSGPLCYLLVCGTICMAVVACQALTLFVLAPVQSFLFGGADVLGPIVYLPHGVFVLTTMLFGWRTLPVLFSSYALGQFLFVVDTGSNAGGFSWMIPALIATLCSFAAFEGFRYCGKNYYVASNHDVHWQDILGVGLVAAFVAAVATTVFSLSFLAPAYVITTISVHVIANTLGLLVLLFGLMLFFRWQRLHLQSSTP